MKRIESIDITRGLVMVIMALDHVRDFIHTTGQQDPLNLQNTTVILFFTRWITHLCAPTFVFLAGVSAYISFKKKNNIAESRRFLFTRGLWLLFLSLTVINLAVWFDIRFRFLILEVIAAIGLSFIVLALLLKLPSRVIGLTGLFFIAGHNLLQSVPLPENQALQVVFSVLVRPNLVTITPSLTVFTGYPLLPWLGILLAGFACGELFSLAPEMRKKVFLRTAIGLLALFVLLRFVNVYGDPATWSQQGSGLFTFLSFINTTKYPPSLLFTLLFTGFTFLSLYLSENLKNKLSGILIIYGRVPLFYYIVHLYVAHSLMFVVLWIQGFKSEDFLFGPFMNGKPEAGGGLGIFYIYLIWIGVVALLYPVCKWYGDFKSSHPEKRILKYL